jgi:hypothetical protein
MRDAEHVTITEHNFGYRGYCWSPWQPHAIAMLFLHIVTSNKQQKKYQDWHWAGWRSGNAFRIVIWTYSVRISAVTSVILTNLLWVSSVISENACTIPRLGYQRFLPNPFQFIVHVSDAVCASSLDFAKYELGDATGPSTDRDTLSPSFRCTYFNILFILILSFHLSGFLIQWVQIIFPITTVSGMAARNVAGHFETLCFAFRAPGFKTSVMTVFIG